MRRENGRRRREIAKEKEGKRTKSEKKIKRTRESEK